MAVRKRATGYEVVVYLGRDAGGHRRSRSKMAPTRRAALALERRMLTERDDGRRHDGPDAILDTLLDRWLDHARLQASTRYQATRALARHVRPRLGKLKVSRLRPEDLDRLYTDLGRGSAEQAKLSASTVRKVHVYLHAALALAVRWGWIHRNPATNADPPPEVKVDPDPPSLAQVAALIAAAEGPLEVFLWLAAETGIRRGGLCALRRCDVDLDQCSLRAVRALGVGSWATYEKATKTGHRHGIALGPALCDLLRLHLKDQDELAAEYGTVVSDDGYLFADDVEGKVPWHPHVTSRRFAALREQVPEAAGVQLRQLRHWMVTQGLESESVRTVSGRAGHARPSTTLDRYAGFVPPSDRVLALSLDETIALALGDHAES